jgi:uncharacterized cupredoxin-like copper-binding protein
MQYINIRGMNKMNNARITMAAILCLAVSCTSLLGKPLIQLSKLEHDFGTIKQETVVKKTVAIKNIGNSALIIIDVQTSCGCTGTKVDKTTIQPGEEGSLEIMFNSGSYNGIITRTIIIHTNDPKNEKITFKITAHVIK